MVLDTHLYIIQFLFFWKERHAPQVKMSLEKQFNAPTVEMDYNLILVQMYALVIFRLGHFSDLPTHVLPLKIHSLLLQIAKYRPSQDTAHKMKTLDNPL